MRRAALVLAGLAGLVVVVLFLKPPRIAPDPTTRVTPAPDEPAAPVAPPLPPPAALSSPVSSPSLLPPDVAAASPGFAPAIDDLASADVSRQGAFPASKVRVEAVRTTIRQYGLTFNGNPVGTNAEITAALNGGNPRNAHFLSGDAGSAINSQGELTDPWGTPYFFHQLSGRDMEVRSAGPDRQMYTPDDLTAQ